MWLFLHFKSSFSGHTAINVLLAEVKTALPLRLNGLKTPKEGHSNGDDTFTIDPPCTNQTGSTKNLSFCYLHCKQFYKCQPQTDLLFAFLLFLFPKKTNIVIKCPFLHWPGPVVLEFLLSWSLKLCSDRVAGRPLERLPVGRGFRGVDTLEEEDLHLINLAWWSATERRLPAASWGHIKVTAEDEGTVTQWQHTA